MRNANRILAERIFPCLLLFLGLLVAGREAPEIARLADDVSNDGLAVSCVQEASHRAPSRKFASLARYSYRAQQVFSFKGASHGSFNACAPLSPGQHLLRLLCVQRE